MTDSSIPPSLAAGDSYFMEIESHFSFRRGTPFLVSAKDWGLMKKWHEEKVPLPLVLEAIDSCFDKQEQSGRKRTISSLSYCRHAVRDLWEERKGLAVGSDPGAIPESDPSSRLALLAAQLDECALADPTPSVTALIGATAKSVRELSGSKSIPRIEQRLFDLEKELIDQLLPALPAAIKLELDARLQEVLTATQNPDDAAMDRARAANLKRLIRQITGIPRLSLFG